MQETRSVEVCLSPVLFPYTLAKDDFVVVLVDILRATTTICTAVANGVEAIIPVATHDEARRLKAEGFLVATEKDGVQLDFADFGNSAFAVLFPVVFGTWYATKVVGGNAGDAAWGRLVSTSMLMVAVLGPLLGGRDGEGLVGVPFAVRGPLDNPQFQINPLSLLVPGAFRELFEFRARELPPE